MAKSTGGGKAGLVIALGAVGLGVFLLSRRGKAAEPVSVTPGAPPLTPTRPSGGAPSMPRATAEQLVQNAKVLGDVNDIMGIAAQLYEGGHRDLGNIVNRGADTFVRGRQCNLPAQCKAAYDSLEQQGFVTLMGILGAEKALLLGGAV